VQKFVHKVQKLHFEKRNATLIFVRVA